MLECSTLFFAYGMIKDALKIPQQETLQDSVPIWKYLVSGGGSGCFSATVLTPIELVKCRIQVQQAQVGKTFKANSPYKVFRKMLADDGIAGLWRGNLSCLAREIPGNVAWYGTYETLVRIMQINLNINEKNNLPLQYSALAGSFAGVGYWLVPFPMDTVKSKLQTDKRVRGWSIPKVVQLVIKEDGVAGLYRGCGITCARAMPAHAALFYCYEVANRYLVEL